MPIKSSRFRALAGVDQKSLDNEINPHVRFFVFSQKPDLNQLVRISGEPPAPIPNAAGTNDKFIARLYRNSLGRDPLPGETKVARGFLKGSKPAEGLEDLLWALFLSPEFQYIR